MYFANITMDNLAMIVAFSETKYVLYTSFNSNLFPYGLAVEGMSKSILGAKICSTG